MERGGIDVHKNQRQISDIHRHGRRGELPREQRRRGQELPYQGRRAGRSRALACRGMPFLPCSVHKPLSQCVAPVGATATGAAYPCRACKSANTRRARRSAA
jgi:hypothetical protein